MGHAGTRRFQDDLILSCEGVDIHLARMEVDAGSNPADVWVRVSGREEMMHALGVAPEDKPWARREFAESNPDESLVRVGGTSLDRGDALHPSRRRDVSAAVQHASRDASDILAAIATSTRAYATACSDRRTGRVLLYDGPHVLGWQRWRELDVKHFATGLPAALTQAMAEGLLEQQPAEPLARVLLGAVTEASAAAATHSSDPEAYLYAVESILNGLRRRPSHL